MRLWAGLLEGSDGSSSGGSGGDGEDETEGEGKDEGVGGTKEVGGMETASAAVLTSTVRCGLASLRMRDGGGSGGGEEDEEWLNVLEAMLSRRLPGCSRGVILPCRGSP